MLVKMAEALGRISLAGRELTRLAGYTERVVQLMNVLEDLNNNVYQRTMIKSANDDKSATSEKLKPNSGKIIYKDNIIKWIYLIIYKTLEIKLKIFKTFDKDSKKFL